MFGGEETLEILKSVPVPFWLFTSFALFSFCLSPEPVAAVHEFTAHRMQHFDLHGVHYGKWQCFFTTEGLFVAFASKCRVY